ncbi:MAG: DUF4430 domain-containing protein [Pseudobutyrivibrio sp.]|nr:DUF4430 domain-containing protein [Pseudobutyrivibrio sp.]
MTEKKNNKKVVLAAIIVAVIALAMLLTYKVAAPKATAGTKNVTLEVVDNNGEATSYEVCTDAEYLIDIFDEIEGLTVDGTTSEYGLYITTVNGVLADYNADGAYWSILVNDEYGQYGADQQPVADGDKYGLVYTK